MYLNFGRIFTHNIESKLITNLIIFPSKLSQNSTEKINYGFVEPLFTSNEQSLLFSAIAIGQLIGTLPITKIYTRFGLR